MSNEELCSLVTNDTHQSLTHLSNMITVSAAVRLSPKPPALVDKSMMKRLNEGLPNRFTESFLSDALVLPSRRSYRYPVRARVGSVRISVSVGVNCCGWGF